MSEFGKLREAVRSSPYGDADKFPRNSSHKARLKWPEHEEAHRSHVTRHMKEHQQSHWKEK